MKLHVKKGDNVLVLAGKDKGKTGKVLSANPEAHTVVVDGVNVVTKHRKPRSAQDHGGIEKVNGNIDSSNVQIICPACGKATRVGHAAGEDGKKIRVCKKCGASLDLKAKAEKKAKKTKKTEAEAEPAEEKPAKKSPAKRTKKTATSNE